MIEQGKRNRPRRSSAVARLEALEPRQLLASFTVTSAADSGLGSFRQAILSSNLASGTSTIDFVIPGVGVQTIALLSPLPTVINPAIINATTQPGYDGTPLVELEGAGILDTTTNPPSPILNVTGLTLTGGSSTVEGLDVNRFSGSGIVATRDGNSIVLDFIGTDSTGTQSLGNGANGLALSGRNNVIGQPFTLPVFPGGGRNVISGNLGAGLFFGGSGGSLPTNNIVEGNRIGTDLTGTVDLGNAGPGVDVESSNNLIGSNGLGSANTIAFNGGPGVQVGNSPYLSNVIDNRIEGNSIFSNVGLGIDLGGDGVTGNFASDPFGPNQRQTFPVLTSAFPLTTGTGTEVQGTLTASPRTSYTVDFYSNTQPDRTGYGQGKTLIATRTFVSDSAGFVSITSSLPGIVPTGQYLSATATDPDGNTSEFGYSQVVTPTAESDLAVSAAIFNPFVQAGTAETYTFIVVNNGPSTATNVSFNDMLPAGAIFVSGTVGQQDLLPPVNGVITANIGDIASGASAIVNLTFTLPTSGTATNKVGVMADQADLTPGNNAISQEIQVAPAAPVDLSLYGVANPYPVQVGDLLTYTFVVTNNSFNTASGVLFTDALPTSVSLVSVKSSQGTAGSNASGVMVDLGTLAGASNASVTIVVKPLVSGPLTNFAMVNGAESDPNVVDNSTTVYSYVTPAPNVDVAVAIAAAPYPAAVGQPFLYVVTVGNVGSAPATGVTLNNVLPDNADIASIKLSEGTYSVSGSNLSVNFGTLPIGQIEEVTIALYPGSAGYLVDRASVSADQPEFEIDNNFASVATPVIAQIIPPAVIDQKLVVSGNKITDAYLTFNEALDANSASTIANYQVLDLGSNGSLTATGPKVTIASATYNATTRSVHLHFKTGLSIGRFYKVVVNGPGSPGLIDVNGNVLDGENNGLQNGIYESLIGRGTKIRPISLQIGVPKPKPTPKAPTPAKHHK